MSFLVGALLGARLRVRSTRMMVLIMVMCAAMVPAGVLLDAYIGALNYQPVDEYDPGDAPAYVLLGAIMLSPVIWAIGMVPASAGFLLGRRYHPDNKDDGDFRPLKLS